MIKKETAMEKKYLFSPGPTMLPPEVLLKMAEPIMHHREPEFEKIFAEIREGLKYLFQTKNEVLTFTSSGTGAMEGAVSNLLSTGDKAIVVRGGKFGERWGEICKAYGIEFIPIDVEWGKAVDPQRIEEILQSDPSIRAVYTQASETSTGVKHPIREIAEIVKTVRECGHRRRCHHGHWCLRHSRWMPGGSMSWSAAPRRP